MAARPVAARGGLTGAHYGMIGFAVVAFAFLGLFVFTLIRVKDAEDSASTAQRRLSQYGSPPAYYADEARNLGKGNVFGVMDDDRRALANLITGNPDDVGASATARVDATMAELAQGKPEGTLQKGQTLLTALRELDGLYTSAQRAADEQAATVVDLQTQNANLTTQLKSKEDEFSEQVAALNTQLEQVRTETADNMQRKDEQLQSVQAALDNREQQLQALKREGQRGTQDYETELARLRDQIAGLQKEIKGFKLSFDPTAVLAKADGRILRAIPGSDLVYINLGAGDHIKPGMGFEVFSPAGETPTGLSGKASVEVVTVMADTAECRVTRRVQGAPILEGDAIVNIAYERSRKPKFVIRGEFDLDYDGQVDFDGLEQVAAIIRQWGGQVVDELDESVDFVVIGLPPTLPKLARGQSTTPVIQAQESQKALELSEYRNLVDKAQKMYIPVITQNPFLYLTGYSGSGMPRGQ